MTIELSVIDSPSIRYTFLSDGMPSRNLLLSGNEPRDLPMQRIYCLFLVFFFFYVCFVKVAIIWNKCMNKPEDLYLQFVFMLI